jgi:hypothetical protein
LSKASDLGGGNGVRSKRVWAGLLGVEQVVVEAVRFEPFVCVDGAVGPVGVAGAVVVSVRATAWWRSRCGRRCPGYDRGRCGCRKPHPSWSGSMFVLMQDAAQAVASADVEVVDHVWIGDRLG